MVIDDARLVQGLISNLGELSALASDPQMHALLKSSQAIALELGRRSDVDAAARRYVEGRRLVETAAVLLATDPSRQGSLAVLRAQLPVALPPRLDSRSRDEFFEGIRRAIKLSFEGSGYPCVQDERFKHVLDAMSEWERSGYVLAAPAVLAAAAEEVPVRVDAAMLEHYLRSQWRGYERAAVTAFTPIAGGFSKQTILFDAAVDGRVEPLVYRGASRIQIIEPVLVDIAQEFHVVAYAHSMGAAVAEPLWLESRGEAVGTRFFISRRVPGGNLGTAVQAHAPVSAAATRALAQALAKIHGLPLDPENEFLRQSHLALAATPASLREVIMRRVNEWAAYFRSLDAPTYPALELAFRWLLDNAGATQGDVPVGDAPVGDVPVLVHGDYGLHNILVHEDRVTAVLDWEACHVGDRALDLSHILAGTAGRMDHASFMHAYVEAGGRAVSEFRLKYYQVLMSMQFMVSTIDAQHLFQRRAGATTAFCTLGLGFIAHTANSIVDGIRQASAAKGRA